MGMAHILFIYEDGLTTYDEQMTKDAVGTAVMSVCLEPQFDFKSGQPKKIRTEAVLGCGNCVNRVTEVHSTDEKIFVWIGNRLSALNQLHDDELENAKRLFDKVYEERKKHST